MKANLRLKILSRGKEIAEEKYALNRKKQRIYHEMGFMIAVVGMKHNVSRSVRITVNKMDLRDARERMHRYDNLILRINRKISGYAHY